MDQIDFESTTISRWYDQGRWDWVTGNDIFVSRLNSNVGGQFGEHPYSQLSLVTLESRRNNTISITQNDFRCLLRKFEIPESSVVPLFNKDGRYTHSVQYYRVGAEKYPSSLCISLQTPSLEFDKDSLPIDSFSLLLRISMQRKSAACIIVARQSPGSNNPTAGDKIEDILQRNYDMVENCPFQIVNLLFELLDRLNEKYRNDRENAFFKLRTHMDLFCKRPQALYDEDGMAVFGVTHGMNILRRKLIPLGYALDFEMAALRYIQDLKEAYREIPKDGNRHQSSHPMMDPFNIKAQYLQTAAVLRQKKREGLEKWAQLNVDILRCSNAQHDTKLMLDDSIAVKMISFATLIFLPVSVVATISGSNAFDVENSSIGNGVKVWNNWWILVIITICLTALVLGGGLLYWMSKWYNARHFTDLKHRKGRDACPFAKIGEMET
ncbi:hypothetical protein F5B19DRAFT_462970 [Rostrohypoxylon terebratum]|nr:hypothetical protein F5B19DRAFT_462970 [Rostrohypoxylon terebratum]